MLLFELTVVRVVTPVATRTRTRKPPPRRGRAPARRPSRPAGSSGTPRKRPPPRKPKKKPIAASVISGVGTTLSWTVVHVRNLPVEAWGLFVIFLGAVSWLGVYASGAGPVGSAIEYSGRLIGGDLVVLTPV